MPHSRRVGRVIPAALATRLVASVILSTGRRVRAGSVVGADGIEIRDARLRRLDAGGPCSGAYRGVEVLTPA